MSAKRRPGTTGSSQRDRQEALALRRGDAAQAPGQAPVTALADGRVRFGLIIVALILATVVVIGADYAFGNVFGNGSAAAPSPSATATAAVATATQVGQIVPGVNGHWTSVTADQLAGMMARKDFTLVNVKTPYMGEIDGTDMYIPYDQIKVRASELPGDKGARILVYCRSGIESAQAAQSLLDLGYTNIWNLSGGMSAWTASGRQTVQKNR